MAGSSFQVVCPVCTSTEVQLHISYRPAVQVYPARLARMHNFEQRRWSSANRGSLKAGGESSRMLLEGDLDPVPAAPV